MAPLTHALAWALWHTARLHRVTIGRPYDAPVGWQIRCHCGNRSNRI